MNASSRVLLALTVSAAIGCKGKPTHDEPVVAETGNAPAPATKPLASTLQLPKASGTPPVKTTKPVDDPTYKKLDAMTFPGFDLRAGYNGKHLVDRQETVSITPKLRAVIVIEPCANDCDPMDLAKWKDKASLKGQLSPVLQQASDTVFEVGQTDLAGAPMIYTYQLGLVTGSSGGSYSDMYVLYYNDGINKATVMAAYIDDPVTSKDALAGLAPKADLEKMAKAFMDVYTHAWAS